MEIDECGKAFEEWYAANLRGRRTLAEWIWRAAWNSRKPERESVGLADIIKSAFMEGFELGSTPEGVSADEWWLLSGAKSDIPPLLNQIEGEASTLLFSDIVRQHQHRGVLLSAHICTQELTDETMCSITAGTSRPEDHGMRRMTVTPTEHGFRVDEAFAPQANETVALSCIPSSIADSSVPTTSPAKCRYCQMGAFELCRCMGDDPSNDRANGPHDSCSEISVVDRLIEAVEASLAYFCDEFPKNTAKNSAVWASSVSNHCGGITPNDLHALLSLLYAKRKPVPVSLEKCGYELYMSEPENALYLYEKWGSLKPSRQEPWIKKAKTVLEAAGVKYVC